jgi:ubiquinone/menaquinone biosynthesis C-methylase UbiE
VADVASLPFPDGSFDLVVSSLSMHHWDHPEAAAPELARVLRPGGRIHIYDMRFAPFAALAGLPGRRTESTAFRTGVPLFPKFTKYVVA